MPVLQLMSDLHLEFLRDSQRKKWLAELNPEGVDVLVLAGDVCLAKQLKEVLTAFCETYPEVVYVVGNHELYKSSPAEVAGILWDLQVERPNLHWLDNESKVVAGLTFVGGTLWFPKPEDPRVFGARTQMNDFRIIRDFEPWVYDQNAECEAILDARAGKADVVVTHHMPSSSCTSPRFRVGPAAALNHYFCRDLTRKIEEWQPPLWCFGHTHDRMHTYIKETTLVANPTGYPHEAESNERGKLVGSCLINVSPSRIITFPNGRPGPGLPGSR